MNNFSVSNNAVTATIMFPIEPWKFQSMLFSLDARAFCMKLVNYNIMWYLIGKGVQKLLIVVAVTALLVSRNFR